MTTNFIPPNDKQKEEILRECQIASEEQLKRDVQTLREWIRQQPHLPQNVCDTTLETMLVQKKNRMEEAKKQIERYFSVRLLVPQFFANQDCLSEEIQSSFDVVYVGICSRMTDKGERVLIMKLRDPKSDKFDPSMVLKRTTMMADIRIKLEPIEGGEIIIYDFEGSTFFHMTHFTPSIGKSMIDLMNVLPMRLKCALFINAPSGLETLVYFIKQVLPEKLQKRIYVYAGGMENLYNHVDKEILPKEYGGQDISLEEMSENWRKELISHREWFLDETNRTIDESKRPKNTKQKSSSILGTPGSFKSLSVD